MPALMQTSVNCTFLPDIMPICFCESYGCSSAAGTDLISHKPKGKIVDTRTFKAHSVADRQAAFRAAEKNTETAIDTEIEQITTYLSASVLADRVSGPSQSPGGSLWSRHDDFEDCLPQEKPIPTSKLAHSRLSPPLAARNSRPTSLHSPAHQASSRRSREDGILASLADIEMEVDALYHGVLNSLAHLGQPSPSGPPSSFPLADLLLLSKDLKSRLEIITFKGPAVLNVKDSIFFKLKNIDRKLMTAKTFWNEELANIRAMKTPVYGLPCNTGKVLLSKRELMLTTFHQLIISKMSLKM
jgi:hypothetical protein